MSFMQPSQSARNICAFFNNTTCLKLWKVWTQELFQKQVEFDRPGERSPE